jgi:hypothetical protein
MKETTAMPTVGVAIACVLVLSSVGCSSTPSGCGNVQEVRFHEVVLNEECDDCVGVEFSSPIILETTHKVHTSPDFVLERCTVAAIHTNPDALSMLLAPGAAADLISFRDSLTSRSKNIPVLIWIEGRSLPVALSYAEDLGLVLTLFDFDSPSQIERVVGDLGSNPELVVASNERLTPEEPVESQAAIAAKALLRRLDEEAPIHEELKAAILSGADDATVRKILDRLEPLPPSE